MEEQLAEGVVTREPLRQHNDVVDAAAKRATKEHAEEVIALIEVMAPRSRNYLRFLQELAKLFVRVARLVEFKHKEVAQAEGPPPVGTFGKRCMARTIEVRLLGDEGAAELRPLGRLGEAHGPRRHSRWANSMHFGDRLSAFWADLDLRHEARGAPPGWNCGWPSRRFMGPARAPRGRWGRDPDRR